MKRIFFLFISAFMVILLSGCGTGMIQGMVIDDRLNPLSGAVIQTEPPTNSIFSTRNGYTIKNVSSGEYTISARKEGYVSSEVKVRVVRDSVTSADIQLKPRKKVEGLF